MWKERSTCYKDKGEPLKALRAIKEALKYTQREDYACYVRAQICWIEERFQDAFTELNRAIELNPTKARYYHFRGFLYSCVENAETDVGAQRNELREYDKALALNYRRGALLYNNIGYVLYEQQYADLPL